MNGKQAKKYRAMAHSYAVGNKVFAKGRDDLKAARPWWRRLLDALFPMFTAKHRENDDKTLGLWYKRTLKHLAHRYSAYMNDPDRLALERAKRKMRRDKLARSRA